MLYSSVYAVMCPKLHAVKLIAVVEGLGDGSSRDDFGDFRPYDVFDCKEYTDEHAVLRTFRRFFGDYIRVFRAYHKQPLPVMDVLATELKKIPSYRLRLADDRGLYVTGKDFWSAAMCVQQELMVRVDRDVVPLTSVYDGIPMAGRKRDALGNPMPESNNNNNNNSLRNHPEFFGGTCEDGCDYYWTEDDMEDFVEANVIFWNSHVGKKPPSVLESDICKACLEWFAKERPAFATVVNDPKALANGIERCLLRRRVEKVKKTHARKNYAIYTHVTLKS
jgi:hypothetical protein